jgi:hypothetical protein
MSCVRTLQFLRRNTESEPASWVIVFIVTTHEKTEGKSHGKSETARCNTPEHKKGS